MPSISPVVLLSLLQCQYFSLAKRSTLLCLDNDDDANANGDEYKDGKNDYDNDDFHDDVDKDDAGLDHV